MLQNGGVTDSRPPRGAERSGTTDADSSTSSGRAVAPPSITPAQLEGYRSGRLFSEPGVPTVLTTDFDVQAYVHAARGKITVDPDAVTGLTDDADDTVRRDLAFVWRLDAAGLSETRAVLSTWTANEARITAFIATWAYERYWFARATRDLLTFSGDLPRAPRRRGLRARLRSIYVERILPVVAPVWTTLVGEPVVAGHMARLAVQEGALQSAYRALLPRLTGEAHRVVSEIVLRRDDVVEFFRTEAAARIGRSRAEAAAARVHLGNGWEPLRAVGVADADEARALPSIFRTPASRADLVASAAAIRDLLPPRRGGMGRDTLGRALVPLRRLLGLPPRPARRAPRRGI